MNVISFPKLGFVFNINQVAFSIGSKPVYWYAIAILTGFILGTLFCMRSAKKRNINPDYIFDIALYGLVIGIICEPRAVIALIYSIARVLFAPSGISSP